jgi:ammonia channel protein AmtB
MTIFAVVSAFAFFGSYVLLRVINFVTPLRVSAEEEEFGLDESQLGQEAYGQPDVARGRLPDSSEVL